MKCEENLFKVQSIIDTAASCMNTQEVRRDAP